ncbi:6-carboxytetrahydropterin synthase QueD [Candidatus Margulisiibacteriota bacterium]
MYEVMVEDRFDAAHQLIGYSGPCEKLHGHGWIVQAYISGKKLNKLGMLVDFRKVKAELRSIIAKVDHRNLNTLSSFKGTNPTSENVAKFIYGALGKKIKSGLKLTKVTVYESPTSKATYLGEK